MPDPARKYQTRHVVIEAVETSYNDSDPSSPAHRDLYAWSDGKVRTVNAWEGEVYDELHRTWVTFDWGDFIIKGTEGEFYPCKPDVFAKKYEAYE